MCDLDIKQKNQNHYGVSGCSYHVSTNPLRFMTAALMTIRIHHGGATNSSSTQYGASMVLYYGSVGHSCCTESVMN